MLAFNYDIPVVRASPPAELFLCPRTPREPLFETNFGHHAQSFLHRFIVNFYTRHAIFTAWQYARPNFLEFVRVRFKVSWNAPSHPLLSFIACPSQPLTTYTLLSSPA